MTSASLPLGHRRVLADLVPGALLRDAVLVVAVAAITAVAAQVRIPIELSPVPITGSTFAVGTVVIYLFGVPWLMQVTGLPLREALAAAAGVFVVGYLLKAAAAVALLPAAWRIARSDV